MKLNVWLEIDFEVNFSRFQQLIYRFSPYTPSHIPANCKSFIFSYLRMEFQINLVNWEGFFFANQWNGSHPLTPFGNVQLIHRYVSYHCCLLFFCVQIAVLFFLSDRNILQMPFSPKTWIARLRSVEPLKWENCSRVKCSFFCYCWLALMKFFAWWFRADVITFTDIYGFITSLQTAWFLS